MAPTAPSGPQPVPAAAATPRRASPTEHTAPSGQASPTDQELLTEQATAICTAIDQVVAGKPEAVRLAVTVLLAGGHLLIEDVPGVGKTLLAKALARSVDCSVRRIQFTPDLLPSDVTGVSVYDRARQDFEFKPGAIFANIVVGDEINRASPKTQSALLECMEERQVTVDGRTYPLDEPFMVIATQNPVEMEGTYPLPEAQRDRFMVRLSLGYPAPVDEQAMVAAQALQPPLERLSPVVDAATVAGMVAAARTVHVAPDVIRYAVAVSNATRSWPELRLGASPRATLHLIQAARAYAAVAGRDYVLPDDIAELAVPVLAHRLLPTPQAAVSRRDPQAILRDVLATVPADTPGRSARSA